MLSMSKKHVLQAVFIILAIAVAAVFLVSLNVARQGNALNTTLSSLPFTTRTQPAVANQSEPGLPVRLIIPRIQVNAAIQYVGLVNGAVGAPKGPSDVAWYQLGPRPGATGSAIISGHFGRWVNGSGSVFDHLSQLQPGDTIKVQDDRGATITFVVTSTRVYNPGDKAPEVFNKTDGAYLNLITCNGAWIPSQKTFTKRLVVFTKRT